MKGGALCRKNSNVFAQFDQKQLAELKEAFSFIDANGDGIVDRKDLRDVWATLGNAEIGDGELDVMMDESPGSLNFTMFLAMLSSRLQEHRVAIEAAERPLPLSRALEHFSEGTAGTLSVAELEKALRGHLTEAELGSLFQDAPRVGQQAEALLDCRGLVDLLANPL